MIFNSRARSPFTGLLAGKAYKTGDDAEDAVQLFAVSPDGSRAGLLGGIEDSFLALYPSRFYTAIIAIQYANRLESTQFPLSRLPAECYSPVQNTPMPCSGFKLSPDGSTIGYQYGSDQNQPDLRILKVATGDAIYTTQRGGNHWYIFTPDNRVLMAFGNDEGGSISLFDPKTQKIKDLGPEGAQETVVWNGLDRAFALLVHDPQGLNSHIWGYNLYTDQLFLSDYGVIAAFTWTPDGSNVLYEKSHLMYESQPDLTTTYSVVQLMLAPIVGKPYQFLGHKNYDFHLCYGSNEPCEWFGNWYPIRRIRSGQREVANEASDGCLSLGINCPNPVERYLINWRSGNLVPSDYVLPQPPTATPTLTPTPAPTTPPTPLPGPDLSRKPVYAHPSGAYAFYTGLDGTSLWLVPQAGEAELWVVDGENFIYVP